MWPYTAQYTPGLYKCMFFGLSYNKSRTFTWHSCQLLSYLVILLWTLLICWLNVIEMVHVMRVFRCLVNRSTVGWWMCRSIHNAKMFCGWWLLVYVIKPNSAGTKLHLVNKWGWVSCDRPWLQYLLVGLSNGCFETTEHFLTMSLANLHFSAIKLKPSSCCCLSLLVC